MKQEEILLMQKKFDDIKNILPELGIEYWFARDLQKILGYDRWENFSKIILKASQACIKSDINESDHFRGVTKMVEIGSGAKRPVKDVMLTRYACYLIAQNGDSRKEPIAFAQTYFALQTRKAELIEERLLLNRRMQARSKLKESETELSKIIYEKGVDEKGFGRIRSKGDSALFGGKSTKQMKVIMAVPEYRPLADFLPTVTIAAKNLATEITNHKVKENYLSGENSISQEHIRNNSSVRKMLLERGIIPEELPAEEDLNKLHRRVKSSEKKMIKESKLPKEEKMDS